MVMAQLYICEPTQRNPKPKTALMVEGVLFCLVFVSESLVLCNASQREEARWGFFVLGCAATIPHSDIMCENTGVYWGTLSVVHLLHTGDCSVIFIRGQRKYSLFSAFFFCYYLYFTHCVLRNVDAEIFKRTQYNEIE